MSLLVPSTCLSILQRMHRLIAWNKFSVKFIGAVRFVAAGSLSWPQGVSPSKLGMKSDVKKNEHAQLKIKEWKELLATIVAKMPEGTSLTKCRRRCFDFCKKAAEDAHAAMQAADPELYKALTRSFRTPTASSSVAILTAVLMAASSATTRTGSPPVLLVGGSLHALTAGTHTV